MSAEPETGSNNPDVSVSVTTLADGSTVRTRTEHDWQRAEAERDARRISAIDRWTAARIAWQDAVDDHALVRDRAAGRIAIRELGPADLTNTAWLVRALADDPAVLEANQRCRDGARAVYEAEGELCRQGVRLSR